MKKKCKHINIKDREFIRKAIHDCMSHKTFTDLMSRSDVIRLWKQCDESEEKLIDLIQKELDEEKIAVRPIRYDLRIDKSNGKKRIIAIEEFKEQIYDYIAYNALDDLASYIGYYQIACKPGQGPIFGAEVIASWLKETEVKNCRGGVKKRVYTITKATKGDLRHAYGSITHTNMIRWLNKHCADQLTIWLISELLKKVSEGIPTSRLQEALKSDAAIRNQFEESIHGLPIGSVISIRLCALYIADVYHCIEDAYIVKRRGKKINAIKHQMVNIDDIYLFGNNAAQLRHAMEDISRMFARKGMCLKSNWQLIDLNPENPDAHIDVLGYRIYRDHITMRPRDYRKTKKALRVFRNNPSPRNAKRFIAYHGLFVKHTDSIRFCRKYNVYQASRKARKTISHHDKSNVQRKTAGSQNGLTRRKSEAISDCTS
jgi:hypothetical protein